MAVMTLAAHLAAGLNLFAVSPLLPLAIDDYGISRAEAGLLISLPMLVGAGLGIPGGMLAARFGLKRSYMVSWAAMALLSLSAFTPNFYAMLALRLFYGVGLALMVASSGPLVMQWFRGREVLVVNALNTAILSLGVAVSVAGAVPLAEWLGWKMTLTVFAGIGVIGTFIWPAAPGDRSGQTGHRTGISVREVIAVLRGRTVALLVAADAGVFIQYTALTGWLPTFFSEARGIPLSEAGFLTSILPFVGMFAVFAGGALPMRFSYRSILVFSGILAILGGLGSFLFAHPVGIYASVIALGVGSWLYVPTLLTVPMRLAGATPERVAVVWGSFMTFSGIGMFISPILVGALRDTSGSFFPGFIICGVGSWALLVAGLLMPRDTGSQASDA
jgi:ACS family D-galactonate transporter-like MFS transporter